jgi:hypothetical protein
MFNSSRVSFGKATVVSVDVKREDEKICVLNITIRYVPFKTKRPWFLVFSVKDKASKDIANSFLEFMYAGKLLHAEIIGLGSWLPLIDNIKYQLGLNMIRINENDIKVLEPYAKPTLVK